MVMMIMIWWFTCLYIVIHWNLIITWATCAFIAAVLNTCGPRTLVICGHLPGGDPRAKTASKD